MITHKFHFKPWYRNLISRKDTPAQYRQYEWIVRIAPPYARPYTNKVVYPGYAFLIRIANKRRPKVTK